MTSDIEPFLKEFFRQVSDQPLGPDDSRYIPIYEDPCSSGDDPVDLMARAIEWTPGESVQLLSGFRGAGKSTELARLRRRLEDRGYTVFLCDIEDYINLSVPVDISDFLMAISGAFSDAIAVSGLAASQPSIQTYWGRLSSFLKRIKFEDVSAAIDVDAGPVSIQANLKNDPSFKDRLQQHMSGHIGALVKDVRDYLQCCVTHLRANEDSPHEVVLLVDSIEHFRGTLVNASDVQGSVETLFVSHAEKLHLPHIHVVYTVPPYLKVRYNNLGALYSPGGVHVLPALKLDDAGYDAMKRVAVARGDWQRLLGCRSLLDRLIGYSGGHLRDLLRLLAEVIRRANSLPVTEETVTAAIDQLRTEFLPIADDDAQWLAEISRTHQTALPSTEQLPVLARFLDTHLTLCYRNGEEWYDVHPLISEYVANQVNTHTRRE